jgi:hypothetical protein
VTVAVPQPIDHSPNTSAEYPERRETMRSTVKHLRYVLGSLSAVLFSASVASSV